VAPEDVVAVVGRLHRHLACSGLFLERDPMPDADALRAIADSEERLRRGLTEIYAWFEGGEDLRAHVIRDVEVGDEVSQKVFDLRIGPRIEALRDALAAGVLSGRGHARARTAAALDLAMDFKAWQTLTQRGGLNREQAVELMLRAIRCAGRS
jgi:hypothetical protein